MRKPDAASAAGSSLCLLLASSVAFAAGVDPAVEAQRAALTDRAARLGGQLPRERASLARRYQALRAAIGAADNAPALAHLGDCLASLQGEALGAAPLQAPADCPQTETAASAASAPAGTPALEAQRQALLASADANARLLTADTRLPGATVAPGVAAPVPSAPLAAVRSASAAPAPAPPAPAPEKSFTAATLDRLVDAWHASVNAGSQAAKGVVDFLTPPAPPTPLQTEQRRVLTAYAGLAPFLRAFAPDLSAELSQELSQVSAASDAGAIAPIEERLKALKTKALAAAPRGDPAAVLAALQRKGLALVVTMTQQGRLAAYRDPAWSEKDWERYFYLQLPIEAEIVLNTKFPVLSVDTKQDRVAVFRGEDYGTDRAARAVQADLDAKTAAAQKAAQSESDARAAADQAQRDLAAAQAARTDREARATAARQAADQARLAADQAARADDDAKAALAAAQKEAESGREASAEQIRKALMSSADGIDLEIFFAFGSARPLPESIPQLQKLGQALTGPDLAGKSVLINGHTDAKGSAAYNLQLSQRRAEAVRGYLVANYRLAPENLIAQGFGFQKLKLPDQPYSEKNRRVQIALKDAQDGSEMRADLEAKAAETQAGLESAVAQKAQAAADAAQALAAALQQSQTAQDDAVQAGADARAALAAEKSAADKQAATAAAVPAAAKARTDAEAAVAAARPAAARALEGAEGVFHVLDSGDYHFSWFGAPEQLAERFAQTLSDGFHGWGAEGATADRVFAGTNPATGRTLAQDVAADMAATESAKSNFEVFKEHMGDLFAMPDGRWINVAGRVGGGQPFYISDVVPDAVDPPQPIPVQLVTPEELARLSPQPAASTGPVIADKTSPPDPLHAPEAAPQPAQAAADVAAKASAARAAQAVHDAELQAAAAAQAKRAADQAAAAAAQARAARQSAAAAAQAARDKTATAAQIRAALAQQAAAASIDLEIYFAYNSAAITPQALPQLQELGQALTAPELKGKDIFIYGHTDAKGGAAYNLSLSQRRAEAVRDYLTAAFGIPPGTLLARGFGFSQLKVPDQPYSERNRRVQIGLLKSVPNP